MDEGENPADKVATLSQLIRLNRTKPNFVDCAIAALDEGIRLNAKTLADLGSLAGLGDGVLSDKEKVSEVGRTTGLTHGVITAFELDNVVVGYDIGILRFDQQIEIEGEGSSPFSQGGDSGSLIVDSGLRGIGLLFAGGDLGGSNGQGLTYANPLCTVLDALKVSLLLK